MEGVSIKQLLQFLICKIDTQLLERVVFQYFKPKHIQHPNRTPLVCVIGKLQTAHQRPVDPLHQQVKQVGDAARRGIEAGEGHVDVGQQADVSARGRYRHIVNKSESNVAEQRTEKDKL